MKKLFFFSLVLSFAIAACKKDETETPDSTAPILEVKLQPRLNATNYVLGDTLQSAQGYAYYYTTIKIVGTNVGSGSADFAPDFLFDYAQTGNVMACGTGDKSQFSSLKFNLGVPTSLNHADPSLPASSSALNITNVGDMHWGWNPGYKFVTIEGKADTLNDGVANFDHNFFFHLGTDFLFREKTISDITWTTVNDTKSSTMLYLDVDKILDGPNPTDLRVHYASHSSNNQMSFSLIIMEQFRDAITK